MIRISPTYTGLALLPFIVVAVIAAASTPPASTSTARGQQPATGFITGFYWRILWRGAGGESCYR